MNAKTFELPMSLRDAVAAARSQMTSRTVAPFVLPHVAPEVTAWAKALVASGELQRAIEDVAAQDSDLAS
jgi:hypothetical protein